MYYKKIKIKPYYPGWYIRIAENEVHSELSIKKIKEYISACKESFTEYEYEHLISLNEI